MIPLGLSYRDARPTEPFSLHPVENFAIICAPHKDAATPKARLALQARIAQDLRTFLPLNTRLASSLARLCDAIENNPCGLVTALNALTDRCQMSLFVDTAKPVTSVSAGGWLRQRAALRGGLDSLFRAVAALPDIRTRHGGTLQAPRLDCLIPKTTQGPFIGQTRDLVSTYAPIGSFPILTGPWAAAAFANWEARS